MPRSSKSATLFIVISMILIFETTNIVKCQPFYEDGNDMSMSNEDERSAMRNTVNKCFKPDDFCDHGSRGCCSGSSCKCNLWGYNCQCQFHDYLPMSFEEEKAYMRNPSYKRSSRISIQRRSCIRRGGACDHRPNECCFSSSCRCNLWGSNCRCQRVGLFQKWG